MRAFQDARGLRVDGICGPETWGALVESGYRLGDRLLYLRRPMLRGDDVAELQRRLNGLGFDAGREDGILGPETEAALRAVPARRRPRDRRRCAGRRRVAALVRLGSLAEGSVAARARTRGAAARSRGGSTRRGCFVVADPGLAVLGAEVARRLREHGAVVALDASGDGAERRSPPRPTVPRRRVPRARHRRRSRRPVRVLREPTTFRSEAGFAIAPQRQRRARDGAPATSSRPCGRTYRLLRETRMAAVMCELARATTPAGAHRSRRRVPRRRRTRSVEGIRRGVEEPLDVTP